MEQVKKSLSPAAVKFTANRCGNNRREERKDLPSLFLFFPFFTMLRLKIEHIFVSRGKRRFLFLFSPPPSTYRRQIGRDVSRCAVIPLNKT